MRLLSPFRVSFIVILLATVFYRFLGLSIISHQLVLALKSVYYVIACLAILSFYLNRTDRANPILLGMLPFALIFSTAPYKVLTLAILVPVLFFKAGTKKAKIRLGIVYSILILFGIVGILLSNAFEFGETTIKSQKFSPNGQYRLDLVDSNQGALGGDTHVKLYKIYFGSFQKFERNLYNGYWNENPEFVWQDNENVVIDKRNMNIFSSETWNKKGEKD